MIKSLVVLLLFALVIYAYLTFIYIVFDVLKWHDQEKREKIIPSAVDQSAEPVDEWVEEHPVKTYAMDFFEKFPNAPRDIDGTPKTCWGHVYGDGNYCDSAACTDCWNQEMNVNT